MNFDLPTFLSVLGVALTILFFVVGYRQTIGARKERARAANKTLIDVLLRRLTLETDFALKSAELGRLLTGWAIDARARLAEMYSMDELEAVLLARVVESDYIAEQQRKVILGRIKEMFKNPDAPTTLQYLTAERRPKVGGETWLALASGLAAIAFSFGVAPLVINDTSNQLTWDAVRPVLIPAIGVIALTTLALLMYSMLRERLTSEDISPLPTPRGGSSMLQQVILASLRKLNINVAVSERPDIDLSYDILGKKYGIEVKTDINRFPMSILKTILSRLQKLVDESGFDRIFLVSAVEPLPRLRRLSTSTVSLVSASELLDEVRRSTAPEESSAVQEGA